MEARIRQILEQYPELCYFGFIRVPTIKNQVLFSKEEQVKHEAMQEELFLHTDEVEYVVNWLSDVQKLKTINHGYSSYRLKHIAEKTFPKGCIANGSFIAGAIIAGFSVQSAGFKAYFNMSGKSLKLKLKEKILEGVELETNIS